MFSRYAAKLVLGTITFLFAFVANGDCWSSAGERYELNPWLLYSIAQVESGLDPGAVNHNADGSYDIGLMQINSWWLDKLTVYGIDKQRLGDPCTNIFVGAWILKQSINLFGNNWKSVGAYNAGTGKTEHKEHLRKNYADKVYRRYLGNHWLFEFTAQ